MIGKLNHVAIVVPDLAAAEAEFKALERELSETRSRLTTVSNRAMQKEREKALLAELLGRLQRVPTPDGDLLSLLGATLANGG